MTVLTGLGVVLALLGIVTVMFHRRSGLSVIAAGVLVVVVGSWRIDADLLVFVAMALTVVGLLSGRARLGKILLLGGVVTGIAWAIEVPSGSSSPDNPVVDPVDACSNVAFVGLRGSGEPLDAHRGYGEVVGRVRDAVALDVRDSGLSFADMPVAYPALGVTSDGWSLAKDVLTGGSQYLAGAGSGADLVAARIESIHAVCGERTRVVVVGYSQGAIAAHLGAARVSAEAAPVVVSVDLVADPMRVTGQQGPDGGVAGGRGVLWSAPDRSAVGPGAEAPTPIPAAWRSWCLPGDLVCAWPGVLSAASAAAEGNHVHSAGYLADEVTAAVADAVLVDLGLH